MSENTQQYRTCQCLYCEIIIMCKHVTAFHRRCRLPNLNSWLGKMVPWRHVYFVKLFMFSFFIFTIYQTTDCRVMTVLAQVSLKWERDISVCVCFPHFSGNEAVKQFLVTHKTSQLKPPCPGVERLIFFSKGCTCQFISLPVYLCSSATPRGGNCLIYGQTMLQTMMPHMHF